MKRVIGDALGVALRAALGVLLVSVTVAGPAQAESRYRYWSFWESVDSSWSLSAVGMMSIPASDELVLGWRYVTAGVDVPTDIAPRLAADFAILCPNQPAAGAGLVNVAFVVDYGDSADYLDGTVPPAPRAVCTTAESGSPSSLALASVASIRENAGFVCGIDELPATGCGDEVSATPMLLGDVAASSDVPTEEQNREQMWDTVSTIVTTLLGVVVFVMAWRRMMLQKANKRKAQGESDHQ